MTYEGWMLGPRGNLHDLLWDGAFIGTSVGGLFGAYIGGSVGRDEKIQIEGMTDSEIQETLDRLRKKARIRDYK
jgi:hypothetical protein